MKKNYEKEIARAVLDYGAITIRPEQPFKWASGFYMPVYNDFRKFMFVPGYRRLITFGFAQLLDDEEIHPDIISGIESSGIVPGVLLAEMLGKPFIFVRKTQKAHGKKNNIEGIDKDKDLGNKNVILIEDVVSTGGSSARAVQSIRDRKGACDYCFSIFSYGFNQSQEVFQGKKPYDEQQGLYLEKPCEHKSICTYKTLRQIIEETNFCSKDTLKVLDEWQKDPFGWGIKNGFLPGG
jgi:orotate phosphoribosyltransferase